MTVYISMQHPAPPITLTLNDGWSQITARLTHLEDGLFGAGPDNPSAFTPAMYAEVHGIAYAMCTQKLSLCPDLYRRIGIHAAEVARKAYVNGKAYNVLTYTRKMLSMFSYLDRSYISRWQLPNVGEVIRDAFRHARSVRDIGFSFRKLSLAVGALGDEDDPIILDNAGGSSSGAGPSGGGRNRNLQPPTDSDDSDVELVEEATFRIAPCVAPGLRLGTTILSGKRMMGLFATRRFEKCTAIGVYTGTPILGSEFNATKKRIAKEYAYQLKPIDVEGTKLSFVIVPPFGADNSPESAQRAAAGIRGQRYYAADDCTSGTDEGGGAAERRRRAAHDACRLQYAPHRTRGAALPLLRNKLPRVSDLFCRQSEQRPVPQ